MNKFLAHFKNILSIRVSHRDSDYKLFVSFYTFNNKNTVNLHNFHVKLIYHILQLKLLSVLMSDQY